MNIFFFFLGKEKIRTTAILRDVLLLRVSKAQHQQKKKKKKKKKKKRILTRTHLKTFF